MKKKYIYFIIIIILLIVISGGVYVVLHAIKPETTVNNSKNQLPSSQQVAGAQDTIRLLTYKSLYVLGDAKGMTIYHDIQEWPRNTKPPYNPYAKCTGACSATWLPFYTDTIKVSSPLKAGDFMTFIRPDGKKQVAYRGWPLYYYTGDSKAGDANGQGIGNIWYAGVSPD